MSRQRIDKWLWYARVVKTRTTAQKLVASGSVRVNRERSTSPSRQIAPGDVLTIGLSRGVVKVLKVVAPGSRRGPAAEARLLYEDLSPPPPPRDAIAPTPAPDQRPDKRDRRAIMKLRQISERDTDGGRGR